MLKNILALLAIVLMGASVSACDEVNEPTSEFADKPTSLVGTWKMRGGNDDFSMSAAVTENDIKILWLTDDTKSLYWQGTFTDAASANEGTIVSHGDREALDSSMLGSGEDNKKFTYKDGQLTYEMSVMGTSRTIVLEKE